MPVIETSMIIQAPPRLCFDLARSIDVHMQSASQTREKAIAGRTAGLIELGETVTWEAVHFGVKQRLTVKITAMEPPWRFTDEMIRGAFRRFTHTHEFIPQADGTLMIDRFDYDSPLGLLGRLADILFLTRYMEQFLVKRNTVIKEIAEKSASKYLST
ncbi:SRPBCC family protein [Paenibacillus beijingensis]|uniref:Cell division protein n=1 Tax=Paenibacillus beijingensis TaxID=1126833 RepID=A0A0D5NGC0_9BACL|nr:SRPBCC family protein [Paenibacillus beijingensis]AJY74022.1 cell division protein [Paenibacillus beijingensis]